MSGTEKRDFRREIIILCVLVGLVVAFTLSPARKWVLWSSEQRAVENYLQVSLSPKEEWEILAWQPAVAVYKRAGADRAIWASYKTSLPQDKPRFSKAIFLFQEGRIRKVLQSNDPEYVDTYRKLWGEPKFMSDILVAETQQRAVSSSNGPPAPEPNWDEPPTSTRLSLLRKLIQDWQRKAKKNELPSEELLRQYINSAPIAQLVALGAEGNCFLDRTILKKEWEERGKTNPWLHPTFLKREDVLISADDKRPFVIRKELVTDLAGIPHQSLVRESEGVLQKQAGGLPPQRLVWVMNELSQDRIALPGDLTAWNCVPNAPADAAPLVAPVAQPITAAPVAAKGPSGSVDAEKADPKDTGPTKMLELTARRVSGGLISLRGKIINQTDAPLENLWAKITTPSGPVMAPVTPKVLKPNEIGTFTRNVRRYTNADKSKVEIVVGKPQS